MFADEKCSLEDFALWIEAVMDNCFRVCMWVEEGGGGGGRCGVRVGRCVEGG